MNPLIGIESKVNMVYEWIIKLVGFGILTTLYFTPLQVEYRDTSLKIKTFLNNPITYELRELIQNGFLLKVTFYGSAIVDNKYVRNFSVTKEIRFKNALYYLDGNPLDFEKLQINLGKIVYDFSDISLKKGESVLVFVSAKIEDNEAFTQTTKLTTNALWNYHNPNLKTLFIYNGKKLIPNI